jgi:dTDP-4-dehydrorhamnose reductase
LVPVDARPLLLGATGLLGSAVAATIPCVTPARRFDARDPKALARVLDAHDAPVVINAIGHVKQRPDGGDAAAALELNAMLPLRLARHCAARGRRLIHVSTDCVFSGRQGLRTEDDPPDPIDLYGHTKLLGEVDGPGIVTLRTSFVGLERARKTGLVEWFLARKGPVKGWRRAIFSGLTARAVARAIALVLARPEARGLHHLAAAPISKHDLLAALLERLGGPQALDITLEPDDTVSCDRSLVGARFDEAFGHRPPSWPAMIEELAQDIEARRA